MLIFYLKILKIKINLPLDSLGKEPIPDLKQEKHMDQLVIPEMKQRLQSYIKRMQRPNGKGSPGHRLGQIEGQQGTMD